MGKGRKPGKVAIVIAGVHRSGTSPLARVASLLGCALPKTLLAANAANATGYWESVLVNRLNDEILALAGVNWRAWQPMPMDWSKQLDLRSLKAKALATLESEFGSARLFVLKDPRICRLIGFWRHVLESFDARPVAVCPIRNPLEVAASLEKRNGLVPALSHLIWLRYVLDAEYGTRAMPRTFARYDGLLNAWRPVVDRMSADLGISWPRSPEQAASDIEEFLSTTQRHHALPDDSVTANLELPEWLRTTYAILEHWARKRESRRDFKALDRIRQELGNIPQALLPFVGHEEIEEARRLRKRVDRDAMELARRDTEAKATERQLQEARAHLDETTGRLALRDTEASANAALLAEVKAQLTETARQLARRDAEANANATQLAEVKAQLIEAAHQLAERVAELEANSQQLQDLQTRLAAAASELARRDAEACAKSGELNELRSQVAQTADKLSLREKEIQVMSLQLSEAASESERRNHKLKSVRASHAKLQADLDCAHAGLSRLQRERDEARQEVKRLDAELRGIHSTRIWRVAQRLASAARLARGALERLGFRSSRPEAKMAHLVASSDLFDRDWYLTQNPDVAANGIDPALHYVLHGAAEGRNPGPKFDTRWYLDTHGDVAAASFNPLVHYLQYGKAEGREISSIRLPSATPRAAPVPEVRIEPPLAAAEPLSFPVPQAHGVRWLRHTDIVRGSGHVSLELSGLIVGTIRLLQANPDQAWQAIADSARALVAFCQVMRIDVRQALRCYIGDAPFDLASRVDAMTDTSACPMVSFEGASEIGIADIWYINDRDLRLRFSPARDGGACVARFFQYDLSPFRQLAMVGEALLDGTGTDFANIALTNAFVPVLITLATPEGRLVAASLLPFPSLCRGGVHYGELCATFTDASYLESLQAASSSLVAEMLGGAAGTAHSSVARIDVDLQCAIGSERIFSTEIREWLATVLQVAVRPANASAVANRKVRAHLEKCLASVAPAELEELSEQISARERSGAVALVLPADAVPSLHALVSRTLGVGPSTAPVVGSFVVAEDSTARPRWAVTIPAMGVELLALQPAGAGVCYPVLTGLAPEGHDGVARNIARRPLAIRFPHTCERHPASLVMPIAPEAPAPLRRRVGNGANGEAAAISVLLASRSQLTNSLAPLLESLRLQTVAQCIEVIATVDAADASARTAVETVLRKFFAGRYRLLEQGNATARNARINRAAEHAGGRFLLVVDADVALHDPRTVETLRAVADHDRVASAGCTLLEAGVGKKQETAIFRSAGIFPSSRLSGATPAFSEPDYLDVFAVATYPVAGNSSALFMVRADIWRTLGGFDAAQFPDLHGDLEYGVRAMGKGFVHLCTSAISAELYDRDFRPSYADAALPSCAPRESWRNVPSSASLVEELKA